jgi:hypothetical protein
MHFVRLSADYGINLAHVVEWSDYPDRYDELDPSAVPFVRVTFVCASEHETGQRQPYEVTLDGARRAEFLKWMDYVSRPSYHQVSA